MVVSSLDSLPRGYRFRPPDVELIDHYLRLKINGFHREVREIGEIDIYEKEPSELPGLSVIKTIYPEWFFFCPIKTRYPNGSQLKRATEKGHWKVTGPDRKIKLRGKLIGVKKTLVFHVGRGPRGQSTCWRIHEYRTTLKELDGTHPGQAPFVLCLLFKNQDETLEGSTCDAAELVVASRTARSSPDDTVSESVIAQDGPSSPTQDKPLEEDRDLVQHHCAHPKDNEVNLPQDSDLSSLIMELHSPPSMEEVLGTSFGYGIKNDISNNETGALVQNDNKEIDVHSILHSMLDENHDGPWDVNSGSEIRNNGPVGEDHSFHNELHEDVPERQIGCQLELNEATDYGTDALQMEMPPGNFQMGVPESIVDQDCIPEASMFGISHGGGRLFQSDVEPNSNHVQGLGTCTTTPQSGPKFRRRVRRIRHSSQILQHQFDHRGQNSVPRRLPLQCQLQIGQSCSRESSDFISGDEVKMSKSVNLEDEKAFDKLIGGREDLVGNESVSSSSSEPQKLTLSDSNEESKVSREIVSNTMWDATTSQSDANFGTGIRIRQRSSQILQPQFNHEAQGSAPRRLRLQCRLQIGPLSCSRESSDFISGDEVKISKSVNLEEEKAVDKLIGGGEDLVGDESVGGSSSEPRKLTLSDSNEGSEVSQEIVSNTMWDARSNKQHSRSRLLVSSLSTEGPAIRSVWSPINVFWFFVLLVFSLAAIGAWRYASL